MLFKHFPWEKNNRIIDFGQTINLLLNPRIQF